MATVEYAALAALVALVTGAAAAAAGPERIPRAVGAQLRRALCLVQGGDCLAAGGPRPCVVRSLARTHDARAQVVLLRLADGRAVLREERADGTVAVTVLASSGVGAGITLGGGLSVGGRGVRASIDAGAGVEATFGRRFVVADGAAADRLVARLAREDLPAGEAGRGIARFLAGREDDADERLVAVGVPRDAEAALAAAGLGAHARVLAEAAQGVRVDRRTGERTVVLRLARELDLALSAPLGARAGSGREAGTALEVTFDRGGAARTVTLRRHETVRGEVDVGPVAGRGGDRLETEARLDLADPVARALADDLLARLRGADPGAIGAARALGVRLADRARVDVRLFATDRTARTTGGRLGLGAGLGGEVVHATETARLVAAAGREPGLGWARRLDCGIAA